ncbi:ABC transporter ATP-binding protein [Deinococcus cellulosilyticus]|uniref:ABC transporter ATP-binding protein n=1 Tax=Deinococcus cellulosilyticus (strain DSM 18568 / NBRC 106333 / KACC 11606 / 5516J-15) TaxID=1223518 RepID=A0A511N466_DEIC1|nr:ABC transporter ATP-binding protein [Deinococcus cellulosilyticus]GEM47653.1 ABC transporter ATP-binding protein [Deinococcus cellulosilyticus NBRC 106333 = KACC 11606]
MGRSWEDLLNIVTTTHLGKRFAEKQAVQDLNLHLKQGEIFGLLGHNGAGKTTTVRLLNGLLHPTEGEVRVFGMDPLKEGEAIRKRVGVLTETPALEERLTARENLQLFADLYDVPVQQVSAKIEQALRIVDLLDQADLKAGTFSKGMKQRLAIARAILHEPELLYLDEPTSGLDPVSSQHISDLVLTLTREKGTTVVLCTHDLKDAQKLCDRVAILEHGQVKLSGPPAELATGLGAGGALDLEVGPSQQDQALEICRTFASAARSGAGSLRLERIQRSQVPDLVQMLVHRGILVYGVTPHQATLEDVYFALHREGQ